MIIRVAWHGLIVSLAIAVSGCALSKPLEPLSFRIWVISNLSEGYPDIVSLVASVENRGNRPVELTLRGRPAHDFIVTTRDGVEIWRWSQGKTVQPMLIPKILNPGEYLTFETNWDHRDNEGRLVPPGEYMARGLLNLERPRQIGTKPTRLNVRPGPPLTLRLEAPSEARLGQKVPLKLRLKNRREQPLQVTSPAYDFIVMQEDREIWRWSYGKPILKGSEQKTLAPGEVLEFTEEWDQRDSKGNPIPSGTYAVRGLLNVEPPGKLETELSFVTIGPGLPLRLSVEAPAEVPTGRIVPLKLRVENISGQILNLEIGYAPYDFIVATQDGKEVWRWTYGKVFPLIALPLTWQPGEVKEYSEIWDQLDNEGYPIPPGTYFVKGVFRASQLESLFETEQSEPQRLVIKP